MVLTLDRVGGLRHLPRHLRHHRPASVLGSTPDPGTEQAAAHRAITREWTVASSPTVEPSASQASSGTPIAASNAGREPAASQTSADAATTGRRVVDVDGPPTAAATATGGATPTPPHFKVCY